MGSKMPSSHHLRSLSGWSRPLGQSSSILHSARLISPSFARQPASICARAACLADWLGLFKFRERTFLSAASVENFAIVPFLGADEARRQWLRCVTVARRADGSIKKIASHPKCHRADTTHCEWISRLWQMGWKVTESSFLIELRHRRRPIVFLLSAQVWNLKMHLSLLCVQSREDASPHSDEMEEREALDAACHFFKEKWKMKTQ
jgi:hypothetical protein